MNRAERIFRLHGLLKDKPRSLEQLIEALEVSRATVVRDIGYMKDFMHAPIRYDRTTNTHGYDPKAPSFELPGLWLNESELFGLLATVHLLHGMQPDLLSPHIGPLRNRIRGLLAHSGHSADSVVERILLRPLTPRPSDPERFAVVADGVLRARVLDIRYHGRERDRETSRSVHPQRLLRYADNWYLIAQCETAQGLRAFSLDRIRRVKRTERPALALDATALDRFLNASFGIFSGVAEAWAVLRFTAAASRWVADETWHPEQIGYWDQGCWQLQVPYSDPRELTMQILKYGPDVQVLAPPELRAAIAERLRSAAQQYELAR
jgi:predicted DNA-binding transcriptional regulator YafY